MRDVIKMQEDLGFHTVTDGEFRRNYWHRDFLTAFSNVVLAPTGVKVKFHTHEGDTERDMSAFKITGKLDRKGIESLKLDIDKVVRKHGLKVERFALIGIAKKPAKKAAKKATKKCA